MKIKLLYILLLTTIITMAQTKKNDIKRNIEYKQKIIEWKKNRIDVANETSECKLQNRKFKLHSFYQSIYNMGIDTIEINDKTANFIKTEEFISNPVQPIIKCGFELKNREGSIFQYEVENSNRTLDFWKNVALEMKKYYRLDNVDIDHIKSIPFYYIIKFDIPTVTGGVIFIPLEEIK